jgi:multimeric flavodoxin WrbA
MKKMLILNGSPHSNGDTAYIIEKLKERINNKIEICELNAYKSNIKPCIDCRYCWKNEGCSINDDMKIIWDDDYDIIVVASPVYMYNVTPP